MDARNRNIRAIVLRRQWTVSGLAFAITALGLGMAPHALADTYTCQTVDVPGATSTQLWQMNDNGQIAAGSSLGALVYDSTTGQWTPLPAPPASSGYTAADLRALAINNHGAVVGSAVSPATGDSQAFMLGSLTDPTTYSFFAYTDPANPSDTSSEFRGISDSGLITGWMFDQTYSVPVPFIYNPTASAIGIFAPMSVTPYAPKDANGAPVALPVPGGINNENQFVLRATLTSSPPNSVALLYDPNTLISYQLAEPGINVALRGLNDHDPNSAANCAGSATCLRVVGFTWDPATGIDYPIYADFDPVNHSFQAPQTIDCGSSIPGTDRPIFEGVNNANLAAGGWTDSAGNSHGLIAYPNVAQPAAVVNGSFTFSITVASGAMTFLDPPVAVGYAYAIGDENPHFGSVTLPIGIGSNQYTLLVRGHAYSLPAGQRFDFTQHGFKHGVASFQVVGIPPSANLDPTNTTAFVTGVTFLESGQFTGSMTPLTAADELTDLKRAADDISARLEAIVERARDDFATGLSSAVCTDLHTFSAALTSLGRNDEHGGETNVLLARTSALEGALACP